MISAPPRVVAVTGSLRAEPQQQKFLRVAIRAAEAGGAIVDLVDLRELALPLYDGDLEAMHGLPPSVIALKEHIAGASGLLIASPEYNHSIPGPFKNAIDWASRAPGNVFMGKVAGIMGTSTGDFGAMRGLAHLRQSLTALGVWTVPAQVTVPRAAEAFDPAGDLKNDRLQAQG